jgi:hypothetical protein
MYIKRREHCNSKSHSNSTSSRLRQRSPVLIRLAGLAVISAGQPAATRALPGILQACQLAVTGLPQGRLLTLAQANQLQWELHPASSRPALASNKWPFTVLTIPPPSLAQASLLCMLCFPAHLYIHSNSNKHLLLFLHGCLLDHQHPTKD